MAPSRGDFTINARVRQSRTVKRSPGPRATPSRYLYNVWRPKSFEIEPSGAALTTPGG